MATEPSAQPTDLSTTPSTSSAEASSSHPITDPPSTFTTDSIYTSLHAYPFTQDNAFLSGLSQIFGHPGTPPSPEELATKPDLVLSAKCFYYTRKFHTPVPVDPTGYKAWLASQPSENAFKSIEGIAASTSTAEPVRPASQQQTQTQPHPSASPQDPQPQPQTTQQPPYPTSFAEIVELITNNKPIPGIEEIPTTVLEPGSSKRDRVTRRKKPWEKDDDADTELAAVAAAETVEWVRDGADLVNSGSRDRGEGLLRLLRPDAVPDSGLVAKD